MSIRGTISVIAPQFDSLLTETMNAAINLAQIQSAPSVWGELFEPGVANLTAHILTLRAKAIDLADSEIFAAGSVTSVKTGDLAVSFGATGAATASGDEVSLRTTSYGLEYLRLQSMLAHQPLVIGGTI